MTAKIGIYGLGTMGAALALNMAEHGIPIAVSNRTDEMIDAFMARAAEHDAQVTRCADLKALVAALPRPRYLLAMIPSTGPMDVLLDDLIPLLDPGDTVIDAGNADFHDTRRRAARLDGAGLHFVGLGVSGGKACSRCWNPSRPASTARPAWPAWGRTGRGISSRRCTTASNMPTCR
jgi:6-phosphogluconate dehydrogenase